MKKIIDFFKSEYFLQLKVIIPTIGIILSSLFGAGIYAGMQYNKVDCAKEEQKYILENNSLKEHVEDLNKLMKESVTDQQQIVLLLTYIQYYISVSNYYVNKTPINISICNTQKELF